MTRARRRRAIDVGGALVVMLAIGARAVMGSTCAPRRAPTRWRSRRRRSRCDGRRPRRRTFRPRAPYVGHDRRVDLGERRPAVRLGLRRHGARAPGRRREARRGPATLDCRNASAATREIAAQARASRSGRRPSQHEARRAPRSCRRAASSRQNEVEQLTAQSAAEKAEAESMRASLARAALEVNDCVLRAPFDGEVADALRRPRRLRAPGQSGRDGRRSHDRARRRRRARGRLRRRRAGHEGEDPRRSRPAQARRRRSRAARRPPTPPRAPSTSRSTSPTPSARCRSAPRRELRDRRRRAAAGDGDPAPRGDGAQRQGRRLHRRAATSRTRTRRLPVLGEIGRQPLRRSADARAGSAVVIEGRALLDDGDRVDAKELDAMTGLALRNPIAILMLCIGAHRLRRRASRRA